MEITASFHKLKLKIGNAVRKVVRNRIDRFRIKNKNFTLITNTCISGKMYHDLGMRFLTPTINLYIKPEQFVKFCSNIRYYLDQPIVPVLGNYNYPVGRIEDVYLYFKHYTTFDEAQNKWNERKKRINWDNLFIIMTDRQIDVENGWVGFCGDSVLDDFEKLPFARKICFTAKLNKNQSCFWLREFSNQPCVGVITNIVNCLGKRMYQLSHFDYVKWINHGESK